MTKLDVQEPRTAIRILDVAERLVQVRGFNGFSYANIAAELQITKAALHYHFASKAELGEALIERYSTRFAEALVDVEAKYAEAPLRLRGFAWSLRRSIEGKADVPLWNDNNVRHFQLRCNLPLCDTSVRINRGCRTCSEGEKNKVPSRLKVHPMRLRR